MKKNITFIDQYVTMGGGQTVLIQLIGIALKQGFQVTVLAPMSGELEKNIKFFFANTVKMKNLSELKLTQGKKGLIDLVKLTVSPQYFLPYIQILRKSDIVYVNGGRFFPAWWLVNKILRIKSIYHIHLNFSPLEKQLLAVIAQDSRSTLICISNFVHTKLIESQPQLRSNTNIKVIENALSQNYSEIPFLFRSSEQKSVAIIGRISKEKGQDTIVEIAKSFSHINFYIIGKSDFSSDEFEQHLRILAPNNVIFLGKSDHLKRTLDTYKIQFSIVPSKWEEPFGLIAIESMALSCVTIVSERGELSNIAKKTSALTFSTSEELKNHLSHLFIMKDSELEILAKKQFQSTLEHFNPNRYETDISTIMNN